MSKSLPFDFRAQPRLLMITVVNLSSVPSFLKDMVEGRIRSEMQKSEDALKEQFKAANLPYSPARRVLVPDWAGDLSAALMGALGKEQAQPEEAAEQQGLAQLLVVSNRGNTVRRFIGSEALPEAKAYLKKLLAGNL